MLDVHSPETVSAEKSSNHHHLVLSVAIGVSCTFVISVMLLVCWVHWHRSHLLFKSHGTPDSSFFFVSFFKLMT